MTRERKRGASRVLPVRKLRTSEDEALQQELTRIDRADSFARDIVIAGAVPDQMAEAWVRIIEAIDDLKASDGQANRTATRDEWAYFLGVAVGLRLAGGAR